MTTEGIDCSHWQTTTPGLTGLAFAFAKASEGTTADTLYSHHLANFKAAGLVTGAYAFARNDVDLNTQAAYFVKAAGDAQLLVVDNEGPYATTVAQTRALIVAVKAHDTLGRKVGLYMSESSFQNNVGADFDWVAHYGVAAPTRHWDFHQYTSTPIDKDRYAGTLEQLKALAGIDSGGIMRNFTLTLGADKRPITGTLCVKGTGHRYLDLAANTLSGPLDPAAFGTKAAVAIKLTEDITSTPVPGVDRRTGWLIGDEAAFLLASDVTFVPTAPLVTDCAPDIAKALVPVNAALTQAKADITTARLAGYAAAKLAASKAVGGI